MRQSGRSRRLFLVLPVLAVALAGTGCAAKRAYRQGQGEARKGNWDLAVARLTRAAEKDPDNIRYRIALQNARFQASRQHYDMAQRHIAAGQLERAIEELDIASRFDPSNKAASDELLVVRERLRTLEEEKRRLSDFEAMRGRVQAAPAPVPMLSARSTAPITMSFPNQFLEKIFDALGKIAGVNILLDPDFRDRQINVRLTGVTFQEALDQITFANRLFYKVVDRNTIIIVPETPAKRRQYEDMLMRTFYVQNADVNEIEQIVRGTVGTGARVFKNASLGALTVVGTVDQVAMAERVIELNDKARGEVLVDVQIMEVSRSRVKKFGLELSNYGVRATFAPFADPSGSVANIRAHMLASFNLADLVVSIPNALFTQFLQTDANVRLLASPRLRASEGKAANLNIGTEVPVPVTTFTATQTGGNQFSPATSFQFRNVGVNLRITPRITVGGEITLEMSVEVSTLGEVRNLGSEANPLNVPTFLTRKVEGILRVRDGETSLIGGLVQTRDTETLRGILGVQSVPILNRIFPSTDKTKEEGEILISLTPRLVRAPRVVEADLRALHVGTQEVLRVPGARPPLFGPVEEPPGAGTPGGPSSPAPEPTPGPSSLVAPVPGTAPATPPVLGPGGISPATPGAPAPAVPPAPAPVPAPVSPEVPPAERPLVETAPAPPEAVPPTVPTGGLRPMTAALSPTQGAVRVGETGAVSLVLMNARDLTGLEVILSYDPATVEAVNVSPGTLLTIDGSAVGVDRALEPGRVRARFTRATAVAGSGMAATTTFRGLRPGPVVISVETLTLSTSTGTQPGTVASTARITVSP